jgi:uncharacterized protein (TIGR03067 family)
MGWAMTFSILFAIQGGAEAAAQRLLLGTWEFRSFGLMDDKLDAFLAGAKLTVEPRRMTLRVSAGGGTDERLSFRLLPFASPLGIDLTNKSGGTFRGIIRVDGNRLEIAYRTGRKLDRPQQFKAGAQSNTIYAEFRRAKR